MEGINSTRFLYSIRRKLIILIFSCCFIPEHVTASNTHQSNCNSLSCLSSEVQPNTNNLTLIILAFFGNSIAIYDCKIQTNFLSFVRRFEIPTIDRIVAFNKNPLTDNLILSDSSSFIYELHNSTLRPLIKSDNDSNVVAIDVDQVGGNLYWADSKGVLTLMSLVTREKLIFARDLGEICDILVVNSRFLLVATKVLSGGINIRIYKMDGSPKFTRHLWMPSACIKLTYDDDDHILWVEVGQRSEYIGTMRVHLDGELEHTTPINLPSSNQGHWPSSAAKYSRNLTVWTDSIQATLNILPGSIDFFDVQRPIPLAQVFPRKSLNSSAPFGAKVFPVPRGSSSSELYQRTCGVLKCSSLCFPITGKSSTRRLVALPVECACAKGFHLGLDEKSCVESSSIEAVVLKGVAKVGTTGLTVISSGATAVVFICVGSVYILRSRRRGRQ